MPNINKNFFGSSLVELIERSRRFIPGVPLRQSIDRDFDSSRAIVNANNQSLAFSRRDFLFGISSTALALAFIGVPAIAVAQTEENQDGNSLVALTVTAETPDPAPEAEVVAAESVQTGPPIPSELLPNISPAVLFDKTQAPNIETVKDLAQKIYGRPVYDAVPVYNRLLLNHTQAQEGKPYARLILNPDLVDKNGVPIKGGSLDAAINSLQTAYSFRSPQILHLVNTNDKSFTGEGFVTPWTYNTLVGETFESQVSVYSRAGDKDADKKNGIEDLFFALDLDTLNDPSSVQKLKSRSNQFRLHDGLNKLVFAWSDLVPLLFIEITHPNGNKDIL